MCTTTNPTNNTAKATSSSLVRTTLTIDELFVVPGSRALIARCDDALYIVAEKAIGKAAQAHAALDFADQDACRLVAGEVRESVSLNTARKALVYPKNGDVFVHELAGDLQPRRLRLPAIEGALTAAHLSDDGRQLLCIVRDDSDFDLSRYTAVCIDLEERVARPLAGIDTAQQPLAFWSTSAGAFFVFDRYGESLWRVSSGGREAKPMDLPTAAGRSFTGILAHPTQPWVALIACDGVRNESYLMQGSLNGQTRWEGSTRLGAGLAAGFQWHPTDRTLLLERGLRRQATLDAITPVGAALAGETLPRGWTSTSLAWSGDGNTVYAAGSAGILVWSFADAIREQEKTRGK